MIHPPLVEYPYDDGPAIYPPFLPHSLHELYELVPTEAAVGDVIWEVGNRELKLSHLNAA